MNKQEIYQKVFDEYEKTRLKNRHISESRKKEIFENIPEYKEVSDAVTTLCVEQAKKRLLGDESSLADMKKELQTLKEQKASLLKSHGYPADYLDEIFDCPDCCDTGLLPDNSKCPCMKKRVQFYLYQQSGLSKLVETENFDNLSLEYYDGEDRVNFEKAVQNARNFIDEFGSHYRNLFFCGTVGTGKSFLSCCIAKELMADGQSILYFSASSLFQKISEFTFGTKEKETLSFFKNDLTQCDLLIIDDLGTELVNSFVASELFSILNERHLNEKSTIISSNLSLEEIRDYYSDRIFSRLVSNYDFFRFTGQDIRKIKKFNHQ
jgi:DNA replication protein DnaC